MIQDQYSNNNNSPSSSDSSFLEIDIDNENIEPDDCTSNLKLFIEKYIYYLPLSILIIIYFCILIINAIDDYYNPLDCVCRRK